MKKVLKVIIIIIVIVASFILLDTLQARILNNSPIISWKEELADEDSWVDRGLLIDTYYCTKEQDILTVSPQFKWTKFTCPIDNITDGTADYLFNLKTTSKEKASIEKLLNALDIGLYGHFTFDITGNNDLYALVINYSIVEGWGNILTKPDVVTEKSAILLALIDNVDEVHWQLPNDESTKITISDLNEKYGDIKEYGKSNVELDKLLSKLGYYEESEPITMRVDNLTNKSLTLIIENHTNNKYLYGAEFAIERLESGRWVSVEGINDIFISIGYHLNAKQIEERNVNFGMELSNGQYRIIKDFTHIISESSSGFEFGKKHIILAEFTI